MHNQRQSDRRLAESEERFRRMAESIRDGRFHCVSAAGHYPWIEQPCRVRAPLRALIAEIERDIG